MGGIIARRFVVCYWLFVVCISFNFTPQSTQKFIQQALMNLYVKLMNAIALLKAYQFTSYSPPWRG